MPPALPPREPAPWPQASSVSWSSRRRGSWLRRVVALVVHPEEHHHRVVLVNDVVAVNRVVPAEVAEAEEQLDLLVEAQAEDVLAGVVHGVGLRRGAVAL